MAVAVLAPAELLFLSGPLRTTFAAGTAWTTGAALPAGATLTTRTATASRTALSTLIARTTRAPLTYRRPHLLQLLELLGRQDLLHLRLYLSLQSRHLLLLVVSQVELLHGPRRQQVQPALSARTTGTTGAAFATRRTFTGRRRAPLFLSR
jgi:hypothetical protein